MDQSALQVFTPVVNWVSKSQLILLLGNLKQ